MATKHIFPLVLDGSHTTTGAVTWGSDTEQVGMVIINTDSDHVTFDSTNFPADLPGATIIVQNSDDASANVIISPDPNGDETADTIAVGAGDFCTIMYHPTHGFIPLGLTAAA